MTAASVTLFRNGGAVATGSPPGRPRRAAARAQEFDETHRLGLVAKGAGWRDRRRAGARPQIDEAAGVLGVEAIDESPALWRGRSVEPESVGFDAEPQRAGGAERLDLELGAAAVGEEARPGGEPLRGKQRRGDNVSSLRPAGSHQSGQRQNGDKQNCQEKCGERREMGADQPAGERPLQACARRCNPRFVRGQRKGVGAEFAAFRRVHVSPGAAAAIAKACKPSTNSAASAALTRRWRSTQLLPTKASLTIWMR